MATVGIKGLRICSLTQVTHHLAY